MESEAQPQKNIFRLKSYILPAIVAFLISATLSYFVATKWSLIAIPIAPIYFAIVFVGAFIVEVPIFLLATKWAKTANRSFDKALFAVAGGNLINSMFGVARAPFAQTERTWILIFSLAAGILTWFFVRWLYKLKHREVGKIVFRLALIVLTIALIVGFVGSMLFSARMKELGL
jgi:uncharacterized membrane protein